MSFFYEAEPPTWKYKERYADWQVFPKRTALQLEKLYKKIYEKGDESVTEYEWRTDSGQVVRINVKNMSSHNQASYYRTSEVSREGYPYPPKGNTTKLGQVYDSMCDSDGFDPEKFFNKVGVNPEGLESLILFGMWELDNFSDFPRKRFVFNFAKCGCSSLKDIKRAVTPIKNAMQRQRKTKFKVLKAFAKWLFNATKQDSRQRTQTTELLSGLLPLVCDPNFFPLSQNFTDYLARCAEDESLERQSISGDDWTMIVEFVSTSDTWADYDDMSGWPLIIGECATENGWKEEEEN